MGFRERPREDLDRRHPAAGTDDGSLRVAEQVRERNRRERLEQARGRMVADVRSRPEDSSPTIRKLLGYDGPAREPQRWEQEVQWGEDGLRLRNVPAGAPPVAVRLRSSR